MQRFPATNLPWTCLYLAGVLAGLLCALYFRLAVEKWLLCILAVLTIVIAGSSISVKDLQTIQGTVAESQDENEVSTLDDMQASLDELVEQAKESIETSIMIQSDIELMEVIMESRRKRMASIISMLDMLKQMDVEQKGTIGA
jgi:hypothetical protein